MPVDNPETDTCQGSKFKLDNAKVELAFDMVKQAFGGAIQQTSTDPIVGAKLRPGNPHHKQ